MTRDELYAWFEKTVYEEGPKEARDKFLDAFMLVQEQRDETVSKLNWNGYLESAKAYEPAVRSLLMGESKGDGNV